AGHGWLRFFYAVLNVGTVLLILGAIVFSAVAWWRGWLPVPYRIRLYFLVLLALAHAYLLALITDQNEKKRSEINEEIGPELPSWWFHFRSSAEAIEQSPLFGWPAFILSFIFLAVLQVYTAILAISSLKYLLSSVWYQALLGFFASII